MSNNLSTTSVLPTTLPTTTFAASITSQFNYLPSGYPVLWSTDIIHDTALLNHATSCWNFYTDWFSKYESWTSSITAHNVSVKTVNLTSASSYTVQVSSTIYPTDVSIYRECDGSPRATNAPMTTSFASTSSFTFPDIKTVSPSFEANPCVLNRDDCAIAWFGSNLGHFGSDSWIVDRLEGACGDPHDVGSPCVIQGGPARLYYFPVDTTEGCAANGTSATTHGPTNTTSAPAQPITTLGTTFDAGSAYISFETLYAAYRSYQSAGGSAIQIGPTFSNTILALRSDEVSTNCYGRIGTQTTTAGWASGRQLIYADLNLPVPASAYSCANQCIPYVTSERTGSDGLQTFDTTSITPNPCETIWNNFNPLLAVPTRLREIVPEWAKCSFYNDWIANVVFDPPTALRQATAEAKPTLSPPPGASPTNGGGAVTTPASPASTASPDGPANTAVTLPRQHSDSPSPASPSANSPAADPTTVPALADSTTGGQQSPSASPESQQNPSPQPESQQPASPSNSPASDPSPQPQSQGPASPSNEAPKGPSKATDSPVASQGQGQNGSPPSQSPENGKTQGQPAATNSPAQSEQQPTTIGFNTPASGAQTPQDTPQGTASPGAQASPASQAPAAVFTVGGNTLTAQQLSDNQVAVGGTTISIGQEHALSNGGVISVASAGIVVSAAESSGSPVFVAGSITASPVAGTTNAAVINGVTLTQGGSAVSTNGQLISFGSSGLQAVSGGQTQMFSAVRNAPSQSGNVLVAGSITASPLAGSSSAVVVNGATLSAGGSAIVTNGQTISYGSSGLQVVSAGHTQAFSPMRAATAVALPIDVSGSFEVPLMTLDGAVYSGSPFTVSGTTGWKIGSQTLLPGSDVTLSNGDVASVSGSSLLVEKPSTTTGSAEIGDMIASVMGLASDMMSMDDAETTSATTTESSRTSTAISSTSTRSSEARKLQSVSTVAFVFAVLALLAL